MEKPIVYEVGDLVFHKSTNTIGIVVGLRELKKEYTYRVLLPLDGYEGRLYDINNVSWFNYQLEKVYDSKTGQYCNRW
jgi:hypothetical protein